jgi:hypothetical protein
MKILGIECREIKAGEIIEKGDFFLTLGGMGEKIYYGDINIGKAKQSNIYKAYRPINKIVKKIV